MPDSLAFTSDSEQAGLIAAAQAGDERAFRRLVEPHRRSLEVHCYRMLGSVHDAEDVVQETLLRAWRSLERFERRASVHTWLYRIATNACLDELEHRPRRAEPVDPYPEWRLAEATEPLADPAARYALHEGMELAFLTAIQRLPGRQRAVLILRDVLGWSAREVADLLQTTIAGSNSALQRARATIDDDIRPHALSPRAQGERELLRRYIDTWDRMDMDGFVALLREDATLRMPPQRAVTGAAALATFWFGPKAGRRCAAGNSLLVPTRANGRPGVIIYKGWDTEELEPFGVMLIDIDGDRIVGFDAYRDRELVPFFESPSPDRDNA
jgi:RNA polymerase sigma-70 factor (ECF subfamily)